jgi:hypothetical protein
MTSSVKVVPCAVALCVALTARAQTSMTPTTMVDLESLAKSHSWAELIARGTGVPPTNRTAQWNTLVIQAANGVLETPGLIDDVPKTIGFLTTALETYPFLRNDGQFMTSRSQLGLAAFETCFRDNDDDPSKCNDRFKPFISADQTNEPFAFAAGALVSRNFSNKSVAMPYFYWALKSGKLSTKCGAAAVKDALVASFELDSSRSEVKQAQEIAFGSCWPTLKGDTDTIAALTSDDAHLRNSCAGLLAHKAALSSTRELKCKRIAP